ncbi:deoxyribose-phosphate aldolase [Tepidanaerobacter sp. EBM-49]|uniref:deoxyribose-phosphate aldolase n=1 Tax=Tepidanaerobacter sp. EBM-49 TaxID=1918504 RepID=UPI000A8430D2|nr:deoxyribose-phosphate aldolase [Tepidanaerobacter sp. EBM-49]
MNITKKDVESIIDASLGATPAPTLNQVDKFVKKTLNYNFAATLTEPFFIRYNADTLHGKGKKLVSVISYPLGGMTHEAKLYQAQQALKDGADELDISMDISAFKSHKYNYVKEELKPFVDIMEGRICKLIYFASLLSADEQIRACEIALELGIPFMKTNTGYGFVTTPEQVKLVKDRYGNSLKVMASGGVRTKEDAITMIEAGADRIATSSAFNIVDSFNDDGGIGNE